MYTFLRKHVDDAADFLAKAEDAGAESLQAFLQLSALEKLSCLPGEFLKIQYSQDGERGVGKTSSNTAANKGGEPSRAEGNQPSVEGVGERGVDKTSSNTVANEGGEPSRAELKTANITE